MDALRWTRFSRGPSSVPTSSEDVVENANDMEVGDASRGDDAMETDEEIEIWKGPDHMVAMFIDPDYCDTFCPIEVYDGVNPSNSIRFLVHLVLSLGHFESTEREVFNSATWKEVFIKAKLLPGVGWGRGVNGDTVSSEDTDVILKRYITEQLLFVPASTKGFDRFVVQAKEILENALVLNRLVVHDIPSCLYTTLVEETNKKAVDFRDSVKKRTLDVIMRDIPGQDLPSVPRDRRTERGGGETMDDRVEVVMGATRDAPLDFPFSLQPNFFNLNPAFQEDQQKAFGTVRESVDEYCSYDNSETKNVVICGGPGGGKTYVMKKSVLCCATRGLQFFVTAEKAERAQEFGSFHIARLFQLNRRKKGMSARRWADASLLRLQKHPELLYILRTVDVIFIDEIGTVSASMWSAMDMILRHVRNRKDMFGGVLAIGTMDPNQLSCINDYPFLTATQVLPTFRAVVLRESVRHQNDP